MPIDPLLVPFLEKLNAAPSMADVDLPVPVLREAANQAMKTLFGEMADEGPVLAVVRDTSVPVDGGAIDVRIYEGEGKAPRPAFVYFHGGAWWLGDLEQGDALCRTIAAELGCSVVSVAYRLAPEHKFPVPFEDCFAATQWVARNAAELGVDAGRLAVGGGSAGGNLAAAVALAARDRSGPNLCFQLLDIPVTDVSMQAPSHTENAEGYLLTRAGMEQGWDHYLARPEDGRSPYASPLLAEDLRDLPPALVLTAEFDPLRDEGEDYARRLAGAGVPVTLRRFEGMIHGFAAMTKLLPQARECRAMVVQALRGAFEG
jgi:acetyl esterase